MSRMISARVSRLERAANPEVLRFTVSDRLQADGQEQVTLDGDISPVMTEAEWAQTYCPHPDPVPFN